MRRALELHEVSSAVDGLFALDAMAEIGQFVALQLEEMEPTHPRFNRLLSSFNRYMQTMGNLANPALEILDEIETDLRTKQAKS